jgi:hypothetical protein
VWSRGNSPEASIRLHSVKLLHRVTSCLKYDNSNGKEIDYDNSKDDDNDIAIEID